MIQYRVSKYDPKYRDAFGRYNRNEWIMHSQIGDRFDDGVLTEQQYLAVEDSYINAAVSFLSDSGVDSLSIDSLENAHGYQFADLNLVDGHDCSLHEIANIARLILRGQIWCKLVGDFAFLHFGWDYYMYIGVAVDSQRAISEAVESGLFVERVNSPYFHS